MRTLRRITRRFAGILLTLTVAGCGSSATSPSSNPVAVSTPTATPPVGPPPTTAILDGNWTGTTNATRGVSFRVLSGQLIDFALDIDFGSGCVYHAKTPANFDPVDPLFPIGVDGRVSFRFRDPALRTEVSIEFTGERAARGSFTASDLLSVINCPGQTLTPPRQTPAGTFTAARP
jgi:hypothetical protein